MAKESKQLDVVISSYNNGKLLEELIVAAQNAGSDMATERQWDILKAHKEEFEKRLNDVGFLS